MRLLTKEITETKYTIELTELEMQIILAAIGPLANDEINRKLSHTKYRVEGDEMYELYSSILDSTEL